MSAARQLAPPRVALAALARASEHVRLHHGRPPRHGAGIVARRVRRNVRDELEVLLDHALVELAAAWCLADPAVPASDRADPRTERLAAIERRAFRIAGIAPISPERAAFEAAMRPMLALGQSGSAPLWRVYGTVARSIATLHRCGPMDAIAA